MQTTLLPDPLNITYFDLSVDDLLDMKDFFEQDDEPLPTDLMVALIDKGIIFNTPTHS